jgi:hypothetical protein
MVFRLQPWSVAAGRYIATQIKPLRIWNRDVKDNHPAAAISGFGLSGLVLYQRRF